MPLFGQKLPVDWMTPKWNELIRIPGLRDFLQSCIDYEKRMHPKDVWSNTPEEQIMNLIIIYCMFEAYLEDRILAKLSTQKQKNDFHQLNKEIKQGKRTDADVDAFLRRNISNKDRFVEEVMVDFYEFGAGDADDMPYDFNPETGTIIRLKK